MFDIDYIAVPIDFSRSSRAALALAKSLAASTAQIQAVHVVDRWPAFMESVLFPYAPLGEDGTEVQHELLLAARSALAGFLELEETDTEPLVLHGPIKQTLVDHILGTPSQLVVAGAFGENGALPGALGSVADRLLRSSGRPTLLVRGVDAAPQVKKIVVGLDLAERSKAVFEVAAALAQAVDAEIEIIHVVPDPLRDDHTDVLGSVLKFDRRRAASASRDRIEALFERLFRELEPSFSDEVDVRQLARNRRVTIGDPAGEIIAHADKVGADLIVVGSQDPAKPSTHLGRVAETVARRSLTHVCLVPLSGGSGSAADD